MTMLEPTPERELPAARRAAIRELLIAHAGSAHTTRPVLMTRRRLALAAAGLAGILAVIQIWPAPNGGSEDVPTPDFVAAWTPVPTPVDAVTAAQLGEDCQAVMIDPQIPDVPTEGWDQIIVDRRGDTAVVLLVNPSASDAMSCLFYDVGQPPAVNAEGPGRRVVSGVGTIYQPLGDAESLAPVDIGATASELTDVAVGEGFGQTAPEVARVAVTLDDGTEVEASLSDGWYLVWWPARPGDLAAWPGIDPAAESITAYDASGKILAQRDAYPES